jgi:hypothetical protein
MQLMIEVLLFEHDLCLLGDVIQLDVNQQFVTMEMEAS